MEPVGIKSANVTDGIAVLVGYGAISKCAYPLLARKCVPSIGYYLANVLTQLNIDLENIDIVGHSIAGHIAGYTGCALNGKIGRITGKLHSLKL